MFPLELIAVWPLMKGRRPGAGVLIAATWSRSRWGLGRLLSASTHQPCSWGQLGWGRAVRAQRGRARAAGPEGGHGWRGH